MSSGCCTGPLQRVTEGPLGVLGFLLGLSCRLVPKARLQGEELRLELIKVAALLLLARLRLHQRLQLLKLLRLLLQLLLLL